MRTGRAARTSSERRVRAQIVIPACEAGIEVPEQPPAILREPEVRALLLVVARQA
jgi:hypothetical protein